jgi:molybdate transport system permease protein
MDWQAFQVSLQLAVVATTALIVLAAPLAALLAFRRFPGKSLFEALVSLPLALPPTVLGFYLLIALGPKGPLGRGWAVLGGESLLFTFGGITLAATLYSLPFAIQPMKATFQKIDPRMIESAYVLGLSRVGAFLRVIVPNSLGGIVAAAILVFLHTLGAFGVLLMVGGSIPGETRVASIAVYEAVQVMDYRGATLMSLAFIPVSYLLLLAANRLNRGR